MVFAMLASTLPNKIASARSVNYRIILDLSFKRSKLRRSIFLRDAETVLRSKSPHVSFEEMMPFGMTLCALMI